MRPYLYRGSTNKELASDVSVDPGIDASVLPPVCVDYFYVPAREVAATPIRSREKPSETG
jgi:hypothetical protein